MPTILPSRSVSARRLTLRQTIRFFWLLGRARWLCRRLEVAHRRLDRDGTDEAGDDLLRAAECWLTCHEEIGALLVVPAPPYVEEVRAVLRVLPRP